MSLLLSSFHIQIRFKPCKIHFSLIFTYLERSLVFLENTTASGSSLYKYQSQQNASRGIFTLKEKPLSLHGDLHLGHCYNKLIKDIILRYKLLSGYKIKYQAGFSCFDRNFEIEAMKEIISINKNQGFFKDYQPEDIRRICSQLFLRKIKKYLLEISKMNLMVDFSKSWFTLSPKYQLKVIEIFSDFYLRNIIYWDYAIELYSFSRKKLIMSEENVDFKKLDVKGTIIKMEVVDLGNAFILKNRTKHVFFLTIVRELWQLTGMQALAIIPTITYVLMNHDKNSESLIVSQIFYEKFQKFLEIQGYSSILQIQGDALLAQELKIQNPFLKNKKSITLIPYNNYEGYGTDVFPIIPAHDFDDYVIATGNPIERKGFIDINGKFNEEAPEWLANFEVFSKTAESMILSYLEKGKMLFKGLEIKLPHSLYFHKNDKERLLPISMGKWFMRNKAIKAKSLPKINDKEKFKTFQDMISIIHELPLSEKAVWGIPLPVFYQKTQENLKKPFINPEILSFLKEKFAQYGIEIWFKWDIKDLLPSKYHSIANTLIKSSEVFHNVWVESCCNMIDLEECTITPEKSSKDNNFGENIDLVIEGEDELTEWVQFSFITGWCNFQKSIFNEIKAHHLLIDYQEPELKLSKDSKIIKGQNLTLEELLNLIMKKLHQSPNLNNGTEMILITNQRTELIDENEKYKVYSNLALDVLRFWVISQEDKLNFGGYNEILMEKLCAHTKIILTCFQAMINQLNQCSKNKDEIKMFDPKKLNYLDKFILDRLNIFLNNSQENYEKYDLFQLYENIDDFFIKKLYEIYLKALKVPLDLSNIGTYYVFQKICELTSIAIAPVFPHLSEKVFEYVKSSFNQTTEIFHMKWTNILSQTRINDKITKKNDKYLTLLNLITKIHIELSKLIIKYNDLLKQKGKYEYVFIIDDPFSEEMELIDGMGSELASFLDLGSVSIETERENSQRKGGLIGFFAMKISHDEKILNYFIKIYLLPLEIEQKYQRKLIEN